MTDKIDTCVYCGRDIEHQLLEQIRKGEKECKSVQCEDGVCCIEFDCDDNWMPTLEKLLGKKMEVNEISR